MTLILGHRKFLETNFKVLARPGCPVAGWLCEVAIILAQRDSDTQMSSETPVSMDFEVSSPSCEVLDGKDSQHEEVVDE